MDGASVHSISGALLRVVQAFGIWCLLGVGTVFLWRRFRKPRVARLLDRADDLCLRKGDMDGAISTVKEAYGRIAEDGGDPPGPTFFRLPLYLLLAGRTQEALNELQRLLEHGRPDRASDPKRVLQALDHSVIYGMMSACYRRRGEAERSVGYGVLGLVSEQMCLLRAGRTDARATEEELREEVRQLLEYVDREDATDAVVAGVQDVLAKLPDVELEYVRRSVEARLEKVPA